MQATGQDSMQLANSPQLGSMAQARTHRAEPVSQPLAEVRHPVAAAKVSVEPEEMPKTGVTAEAEVLQSKKVQTIHPKGYAVSINNMESRHTIA